MAELATEALKHIELPDYALAAIRALEAAGHEAWCVGGCVRDALLGRDVHDYDIATSATWQQTESVLCDAGFAVHRTGTKHGTVTASIFGNALEVTTYRTDGDYSDGRHPDEVIFVNSIEEDLARRDFTVNAMAYHPERGLLDCFGGTADLESGTIRTVGDAFERFTEDALRILRACRFRAQLGFSIEESTLTAMVQNKRRLFAVSAERVTHELQEMLLGPYVYDAIMDCVDALGAIMPELSALKGFEQHTPYHIYDVLEHTAWVVQRIPATPLERWSALFHDFGKPGAFFMDGDVGHFYGHPTLSVTLAGDVMRRLRLSPSLEKDILVLVKMHDAKIPATTHGVRRALAKLDGNTELFRALCHLKQSDALAQSGYNSSRIGYTEDLERVLDELIAENAVFTVKDLTVNGSDVIQLGVPEGPDVGKALQRALDEVLDERLPNERNALLAFLAEQAK